MPSQSLSSARDDLPDAQACAAALFDVLPAVMDAMRFAMRDQLGEGLSVPQFRCLRFIADKRGTSVSEVAGFLGVTLATASAMIERLVRAGYVVSATSRIDRRRTVLNATGPGRALMGRIRRGAQAELAQALAASNDAELAELSGGLEVLKARFHHG
jgi:DNA-binding MarR family transcriptional regulator